MLLDLFCYTFIRKDVYSPSGMAVIEDVQVKPYVNVMFFIVINFGLIHLVPFYYVRNT